MKKTWRIVREVLRGAAAQAVARILVGLLAALGLGDVVVPGESPADGLVAALLGDRP